MQGLHSVLHCCDSRAVPKYLRCLGVPTLFLPARPPLPPPPVAAREDTRLCDSVMERYRRHVYLLRRQILQGGSAARGRLLQRYFQASRSAAFV